MNEVGGRGRVITNFVTFTGIEVVGKERTTTLQNEVPFMDSVEKFGQLQPVLAISRHLVNNAVHFR